MNQIISLTSEQSDLCVFVILFRDVSMITVAAQIPDRVHEFTEKMCVQY